jgi:hypothetical protein
MTGLSLWTCLDCRTEPDYRGDWLAETPDLWEQNLNVCPCCHEPACIHSPLEVEEPATF